MTDENAPPIQDTPGTDEPREESNDATTQPPAIMLPIGLVFLAGSIALIVWASGAIFEHMEASKTFQQTTARVIASGSHTVRTKHDGVKRVKHQDLDLIYEYNVDGNRYTSSLVDFGENIRPTKLSVNHLLSKYPEGANVPVHYDPSNPDRAILQLAWPAENLLTILMGAAFGFLFLGLMFKSVANPTGGALWALGRVTFEPGRLLVLLVLVNAALMCFIPWYFGPLTVNASLVGGGALGLLIGLSRAVRGPGQPRPDAATSTD